MMVLMNLMQEYLCYFCDPPVCHISISSSNVMLDANYVAKVIFFIFKYENLVVIGEINMQTVLLIKI